MAASTSEVKVRSLAEEPWREYARCVMSVGCARTSRNPGWRDHKLSIFDFHGVEGTFQHTSVFSKARRHLMSSSSTVSSTSVSFFRFPPLLTRRDKRSPRTTIPDSVLTKSSIHARLAVEMWTRREMSCLTSFVSVVRPLRIPTANQLAVFSVSLDLSTVPPDEDHQLLQSPPVPCG